MSGATNLVIAASGISFAGAFVESKGFPDDGYKRVAASAALIVIVAAVASTRFEPVVTALAWLILIGALFGSVPALTRKVT